MYSYEGNVLKSLSCKEGEHLNKYIYLKTTFQKELKQKGILLLLNEAEI